MTGVRLDSAARPERTSLGLVLALALVLPTLVTWLYFVVLADQASHWQQLAATLGKSVQFLLPIVWVVGVQQRKLRWSPPGRGLWEGALFGVAVVMLMLVAYHVGLKPWAGFHGAAAAIREKVQQIGISSTSSYVGLGAFYALVHSGLEEYYWRWFVFRQLKCLASVRSAVLISSLGFMAHHVILLATFFGWGSPLTYLGSLGVAIGGAYWAWLYQRTGSLMGSWLSHLVVDAGIFLVGYDIVRPTLGGVLGGP